MEIQRAVEEVSSGTIDDEKNDIHIDILRRIVPGMIGSISVNGFRPRDDQVGRSE